jgi:hypothetical protein
LWHPSLPREEKIAENLKNQRELRAAMAMAEKGGGKGGLAYEDFRNQLATAQLDLAKLDKPAEQKNAARGNEFKLQSGDSLTRTGNFLGASSTSIVSIGERTNQLLTQIHTAIVNAGKGNQNGNLNGSTAGPTAGFSTH